jgi:glutamate/tyrosine decarboxylase-like PLP-dependent enzyme
MTDRRALLVRTAERIADYRDGAGHARVAAAASVEALRAAFGLTLPADGEAATEVIDRLVAAAEPGLVNIVGPRYFGFVNGGSLDAALCADLLGVGWDQNAFNPVTSPASALAEEAAGVWLKDLLMLPADASFGFVTGGQGANTVGLAAARHRVLATAGWDVEEDGLVGAPRVRVVASAERHATIDRSLRLLGLGRRSLVEVAATAQGAIDVDALAAALAAGPPGTPTIVCAQAGNVNTGACDDLSALCELAHSHGAWVHVDGAFGLWAAAAPARRHLVTGLEAADSWACDGHKWLNVPYDCGYVFCADGDAHRASMSFDAAAYLAGQGDDAVRSPADHNPESSRRARGFATWAALRQLGRSGVADLVERCCAQAVEFADQLAALPGVSVANDVVLNQVLVDFGSPARTDAVIGTVQRDGTCWMGGTVWQGRRLMRISVSNGLTTPSDVEQSVASISRALAEAPAA